MSDVDLDALARAKLLAIVGPTASGKTDLAMGVAERVSGEIISADSIQIYRGFDIGSGKVTIAERARVPHHLIDIREPDDPIDAATFASLAEAAIADVRARGKIPILCGGTFLWVRALVLGLVDAPRADPAIRERHRHIVDTEGRNALHAQLVAVDPTAADRLHPNDVVRVSRALEVYELSGRTLSDFHEGHGFRERRHDVAFVGIQLDAETLTKRIEARVDGWLANGFIEEVEGLVARGYGDSRPMGSVGYAQVRAVLRGELPRAQLREKIVQATRIFARRQRTWLKTAGVLWV